MRYRIIINMFREKCLVLENKKVAPAHFILKMRSAAIAKRARPGQFVQVLCADSSDPLLPRPFSFLTATKNDFSLLYQVVGKGTRLLEQAKKGDTLWVLGPLGNGFNLGRRETVVLAGGGVGIPPLYHLAEKLVEGKISVHVFLGARNKNLILCEKEFRKLGVGARHAVPLHIATEDGSKGAKGLVTKPLEDFLKKIDPKQTRIYTCGPTPMLKAVSLLSQKYGMDCEVSVEEPMACGFGACLGCAIRLKTQKSIVDSPQSIEKHDAKTINYRLSTMDCYYAMACTEGPVFKADEIIWE